MLHWTNQNWAKRDIRQKAGQNDKTKRQDKKTGQKDRTNGQETKSDV